MHARVEPTGERVGHSRWDGRIGLGLSVVPPIRSLKARGTLPPVVGHVLEDMKNVDRGIDVPVPEDMRTACVRADPHAPDRITPPVAIDEAAQHRVELGVTPAAQLTREVLVDVDDEALVLLEALVERPHRHRGLTARTAGEAGGPVCHHSMAGWRGATRPPTRTPPLSLPRAPHSKPRAPAPSLLRRPQPLHAPHAGSSISMHASRHERRSIARVRGVLTYVPGALRVDRGGADHAPPGRGGRGHPTSLSF